MARTFIDYKDGKGCEINESYIQLAFYYIYQEINKIQYSFSNKDDLIYDFEKSVNGLRNGYFVLNWADDFTSQLDEQTMLEALLNVKISMKAKGKFISVPELQTIVTDDEDFKLLYSRNPFPTAELIKIIDALRQMLEGNWESRDYSMDINYRY